MKFSKINIKKTKPKPEQPKKNEKKNQVNRFENDFHIVQKLRKCPYEKFKIRLLTKVCHTER